MTPGSPRETALVHLLSQQIRATLEPFARRWSHLGTLAYQCAAAARMLPRHPRHFGGGLVGMLAAVVAALLRPAFGILGVLLHRLEMRHKLTSRGYPKNYVVIARKPSGSE